MKLALKYYFREIWHTLDPVSQKGFGFNKSYDFYGIINIFLFCWERGALNEMKAMF